MLEHRVFQHKSQRVLRDSDGRGAHVCVYTAEGGLSDGPHRDAGAEARCRAFLETAPSLPDRTIQGLRRRFLNGGTDA